MPLATRFISQRLKKHDSVILVADDSNAQKHRTTGFCQLYRGYCSLLAQLIYTLYDLFVATAARKTGTGRALLIAAACAAASGFARLDLSTSRSSHAAQAVRRWAGSGTMSFCTTA